MLTSKPELVSSELNRLAAATKDRQAAFSNAARRCNDERLARVFREFASERGQFAEQLQDEVSRLGEAPETSGTVAAAFRRGLANVRSELADTTVPPELEECHLQEFFAEKKYGELLERDLPRGVPSILRTQLKRTRVALGFLRDLRTDDTVFAADLTAPTAGS